MNHYLLASMYSIRATAPSVVSSGGRTRSNSAPSVEHRRRQQQQQQQQGAHAPATTAAGEPSGEEGASGGVNSNNTSSRGIGSTNNLQRLPRHLISTNACTTEQGSGMNVKRESCISRHHHKNQYPQQMATRTREVLPRDMNASARSSAAALSSSRLNAGKRTTTPVRVGDFRTRPRPTTPKRTRVLPPSGQHQYATPTGKPRGAGGGIVSTSSKTGTPSGTCTRIINSPLIDAPPTPTPDATKEGLVEHDDRWRAMSALAGSHKQSARLLDLSNRSLPPEALKYGVPPKTAGLVTELKYDGNMVGEDDLPSFLDIIVPLFPKLRCISLRDNPCCPTKGQAMRNNDNIDEEADDNGNDESLPNRMDPKLKMRLNAAIEAAEREQVRMQRLYIIYRLPDLVSIDGVTISSAERHLACPLTPVGTPVKKDEWLTKAMAPLRVDLSIGADDACDSATPDRAMVGLNVASGGAEENPGNNCSEIIFSRETGGTTSSAVEVSISGLVHYVRTEHKNVGTESSSSDSASDDSGDGNGAQTSPSLKKPVPLRTSTSLPPPSPASKPRNFSDLRQKKRRNGRGSWKNQSSSAARELWRLRKKNVASMVDDDSDEGSTDEEDEIDKNTSASERADEQEEEVVSSADWSGTMGTISNMED